jgi:branched-chain amino acid transport system permease protein
VNGQFVIDGLLNGAMIGLGAIGLTLAYSVLRFANFAHGEFISWGGYIALLVAGGIGSLMGNASGDIGNLTFGWPLILALPVAALGAGGLALALDAVLFRRLRQKGTSITLVIASFGASLALRSLLEFLFSDDPRYYSTDIAIATPLGFGMRATADQLGVLGFALVLMVLMHLVMTRSRLGWSLRAVSENPDLARLAGIDVAGVIRMAWLIGGGLAGVTGVLLGQTVQLRPTMGFDLLLPLFSAAILGGIGSVPGAMLGGLIIGLAEALSVPLIGAEYRAAVAFLVLLGMLLVRPTGLFGVRT